MSKGIETILQFPLQNSTETLFYRLKLNTSLNRRLYAEFEAAELTLIRIGSIKEEANVTAQIFLILFIIASIVIVGLLIYGFFLITDTLE